MFPKKQRLSAREVQQVLKEGRSLPLGPYRGKLLATTLPLRVAVIVPKSVSKSAVVRNRARRAAYQHLPTLSLPAQGSLLVFVRAVK